MTSYTYEDFVGYYGGTSPETLRRYAEQSRDDLEQSAMFIRLAEEKEHGVVFLPDVRSGKLRYRRAQGR